MFSGVVPGLNSVNSSEDELSVQIPASLIKVVYLTKKFLSNKAYAGPTSGIVELFGREWSGMGGLPEWRTLALFSIYAGIVITVGLISLRRESEDDGVKTGGDPAAEDSLGPTQFHGDGEFFSSAFLNANTSEIISQSDSEYAEELQVQEVLRLSMVSAEIPVKNWSLSTWITRLGNTKPSQSSCGICFEDVPNRQMFQNISCSHSFCRDCTTKHITAKIQENAQIVLCPEVGCKAALDFNACRAFIPREVLIQWDECLCKSLFPESQRVYCPFRDCSAMLLNDSGEVIGRTYCPECLRAICVECLVPWHTEFGCKEFQRLTAKRRGEGEILLKELAKKKSWRRCPNCKVYVEKTEGCLHMTCRCRFEFCYSCGSRWSVNHGCHLRS